MSIVIVNAADTEDWPIPGCVCVAVIAWAPLLSVVEPFVVTLVVVPEATAEPISAPLEKIDTVAPAIVPPTINVRLFEGLLLSLAVRLSEADAPVSLADDRTGTLGVGLGGDARSAMSRLAIGEPRPVTRSYPGPALKPLLPLTMS